MSISLWMETRQAKAAIKSTSQAKGGGSVWLSVFPEGDPDSLLKNKESQGF